MREIGTSRIAYTECEEDGMRGRIQRGWCHEAEVSWKWRAWEEAHEVHEVHEVHEIQKDAKACMQTYLGDIPGR